MPNSLDIQTNNDGLPVLWGRELEWWKVYFAPQRVERWVCLQVKNHVEVKQAWLRRFRLENDEDPAFNTYSAECVFEDGSLPCWVSGSMIFPDEREACSYALQFNAALDVAGDHVLTDH